MPLHRLLGAIDARVPVYGSGGLYADGKDVRALAAEMSRAVASGFDTVKMKIAALSLADDMARVAAVRAAIGPRCTLIVDAVERLTRQTAPDWVAALRRYGVTHIQAPLPADDRDGMAVLPAIAVAGEREYRPAAFQALLDCRSVGLLQFNPGLAGGISGANTLIGMAGRAGVPVTLQCYSTAILQAVCFQLAAGRAGVHSAEYHQFHDNLYEALPACMTTVEGGHLVLDDGAGLGIDPGLPDRVPARGTIRPVFRLSA